MTADELIALANDPRFIKDIHQYCDGWCERCAFTTRCFHFAQIQTVEDEAGFDPTDPEHESKQLLRTLHNSFELAAELIERGAAEHGIDIHSAEFQADLEEADDEHEQRFQAAHSHPLTQAAEEYAFAVQEWFDRAGAELEKQIRHAQRSEEILADQLQPEDVQDAIEIVRWHQFRAIATLVGIFGIDDREGLLTEHHNGKIKSILLGIDHSLLAWGRVQLFWPQAAREIMHFASLLAELRLWLERAFPESRDFLRPGFDDASTLLM
jgi:hypothetical protein